jgi:hypothetical protein
MSGDSLGSPMMAYPFTANLSPRPSCFYGMLLPPSVLSSHTAKMNTSCRPYLTSPDNGSMVIDLASQMHISERFLDFSTFFSRLPEFLLTASRQLVDLFVGPIRKPLYSAA